MARRKYTRFVRLLKEGDKFQQPDSEIENIWTVKRVEDQGDGWVKVFVENRQRSFEIHGDLRVNLHYDD